MNSSKLKSNYLICDIILCVPVLHFSMDLINGHKIGVQFNPYTNVGVPLLDSDCCKYY